MKNGITLSIIIIAVAIMLIIVSSATVIGTSAINAANYEEFKSQLSRVSDEVNRYYTENKDLPILDYQVVSKEMTTQGFAVEIKALADDMNNLYIVDVSKLKLTSVKIGSGTVEDKDVFLVAEDTGNVYYYKGFKYRNEWFYGLEKK